MNTFKNLCNGRDELAITQVRQIALLATDGLCPGNIFLNDQGGPLNMRMTCENTYRFVAKYKPAWWHYGRSQALMFFEAMAMAVKRCSLDPEKHNLLTSIPKQKTLSFFRKMVLTTLGSDNVKAIHFFRWDGSCRSSVNEITWAICHYPSKSSTVRQTNAKLLSNSLHLADKNIFNDSARNVTQKKPILMFVVGLGCTFDAAGMQNMKEQIEKKYRVQTRIYCNQSLNNTMTQIGKNFLGRVPRMKDSFPQYIYAEIKRYLHQNYKVFVWGHSYGGSIVSRIAEFLSEHGLSTPALQLFTFGSIYVPLPSQTSGVNIKHYMFYRDVALKVNKLNPERDTFVHWMRSEEDNGKEIKNTIFGSALEWDIHNSYSPFGQIEPTK